VFASHSVYPQPGVRLSQSQRNDYGFFSCTITCCRYFGFVNSFVLVGGVGVGIDRFSYVNRGVGGRGRRAFHGSHREERREVYDRIGLDSPCGEHRRTIQQYSVSSIMTSQQRNTAVQYLTSYPSCYLAMSDVISRHKFTKFTVLTSMLLVPALASVHLPPPRLHTCSQPFLHQASPFPRTYLPASPPHSIGHTDHAANAVMRPSWLGRSLHGLQS
jgi:hypothetical protein